MNGLQLYLFMLALVTGLAVSETSHGIENGLFEPYCVTTDKWDDEEESEGCSIGKVGRQAQECVYNGPVNYDFRNDEDHSHWLDWPVARGRCVKGLPNGTWHATSFERVGHFEPEFWVKYQAKGRFTKGIPVGAHVLTDEGLIVEAACYMRHREAADGEVHYHAQLLWHFRLSESLPEQLLKPSVEDFLELEKPVMEEVAQPDRSDYEESQDFRDALRDHNYYLSEAKATFREAMAEYKKERRDRLPEARELLKEAMVEYREELAEYKQKMADLKAESEVLTRLVKACPKLPQDVCYFGTGGGGGSCAEVGACGIVERDRWKIPWTCHPKSNAHCRQSEVCKNRGECTLVKGGEKPPRCEATKSSDCDASTGCKEKGQCVLEAGVCTRACKLTSDCKQHGLCETLGEECVAKTRADCEQSDGCHNNGKCTPLDGRCVAQGDDCVTSGLCAKEGRCRLQASSGFDGQCVVGRGDCARAQICRVEGLCRDSVGGCQAGSIEDCKRSKACTKHKRCIMTEGRCEDARVLVKQHWSLERVERASFDEKAKAREQRRSKTRRRKIKMLQRLVGTQRPMKALAEALFKLAEAQWEESKYLYLLNLEKYDEVYEKWEENKAGPEPQKPVANYEESLKRFRLILSLDKDYRRIDQVHYYLAKAMMMAGKANDDIRVQKEAVKRFNDLVQNWPDSKLIAQSHLALGEYFFETDSLSDAKQNFERIIQNDAEAPVLNYALYRLGWAYIHLTEYSRAAATFAKAAEAFAGHESNVSVDFKTHVLACLEYAKSAVD